jgi:hypothetical protein
MTYRPLGHLTGGESCGNKKRGAFGATKYNRQRKKGTTVTIVRVGTTKKYSDGWEGAFGRKGGVRAAGKSKTATPAAKKSKKKLVQRTGKK